MSNAYARELQSLSGVDLSVPEIRERVTADRQQFGAFVEMHYTDTSEANMLKVKPYLVTALDNVVQRNRQLADAQLSNELRPVNPGEQRYYTGDLYLPVYREGIVGLQQASVVWGLFVGGVSGLLVAAGFVLLQQRQPRVNNDDDLQGALGLRVWTHVGRAGRRYGATSGQYAQVVTSAREAVAEDASLRHIVIATATPDRNARALAMGTAAALAAEGRRVLLVDGQADRPLLSARLGGFGRHGLVDIADGTVDLASVVHGVWRWRLPSSVRRTAGPQRRQPAVPACGCHPSPFQHHGPPRDPRSVRPGRHDRDVGALAARRGPGGTDPGLGDAVILALVEGRTVTFDAEDAAALMQTFVVVPDGVVMLDV